MSEKEMMQYVQETARFLYQNKECEALGRTRNFLEVLQEMLRNLSSTQLQIAGEFSIVMLRELMDAYQNNDMLAMADCLMEKVTIFIPFYFQKM